jgi:YVTN family beta-propeller protein
MVGASADAVRVIDVATGTIVQTIPLGSGAEYPVDVVFSANGSSAYVSSRDDSVIVPISTSTYVLGTPIALPSSAEGGKMVLNPCDSKIYVVDWFGPALFVVDPATSTVTPKTLGVSLWDLAVSPDGKTLYVTDRGPDTLIVYDVATLTPKTSIPVCADPWGVDITPDGSTVIVACEDDHALSFVDTTTLVATPLALGADSDPRDVEISADGKTAYVPTGSIAGDDGVYVVDIATKTIKTTLTFGTSANSNVIAVAPPFTQCVP